MRCGTVDEPDTVTIEGLRHARSLLYKQWDKERQRVVSHQQTIERLKLELRTAHATIAYLKETEHYHG